MSGVNGVKKYFEQEAGSFDSIYSDEKSLLWRLLDRYLRSDIYERFRLTLEACGDFTGKTVLDIGCGSGRYAAEYARRGARHVHGLDLSEHMIELARQFVENNGFGDRCSFEVADFMEKEFDAKFDFAILMGVLDYVADPVAFLNKLVGLTNEKAVVSFPSRSFIRGDFRMYRYGRRGCPLFLYDREGIERVVQAGPAKLCRGYTIQKIHGWGYDFVVVFEK